MKPAVCAVCGKSAVNEIPTCYGDWVSFADCEILADSFLGHPQGVEYFCGDHLTCAERLASKPLKEALSELLKAR